MPFKVKELRAAFGLGDYGLEDTKNWGVAPAGLRLPVEAGIIFPSTERLEAGAAGA